jgi:AraC family transcriptional regulator
MEHLKTGQFYGQTNQSFHSNGIILTDTEYTHDYVDWHYHENAYFTFILQGSVLEGNKKETYHCDAGSLLFHNWQESHFNIKPKGFTRGFHLELEQSFFTDFLSAATIPQGSVAIPDVHVKLLFYRLFSELKLNDGSTPLSIESLVLQVFSLLQKNERSFPDQKPKWVNEIKEFLHEQDAERTSLQQLSSLLNIHPVHLSRDFSKHFGCTLGHYTRKIKIERALQLLPDKKYSLGDIAFHCGFSDQSHFFRCFKTITGISPSHYRKLL